jgi:hypothetical protein
MSSAQAKEDNAQFRPPSRISHLTTLSTPDSRLELAQYKLSTRAEARVVAASPEGGKCSILYFEAMEIEFAHCIPRALASAHDLVCKLFDVPL